MHQQICCLTRVCFLTHRWFLLMVVICTKKAKEISQVAFQRQESQPWALLPHDPITVHHVGVRVLAHEFAYSIIIKELLMCLRFQSPYTIPMKVAKISDSPEQYSLLFKCETRLQLTRPDDKSSVLSIVLLTLCGCISGEKYLLAPERYFGCSNIYWGRK